jgi:hypothetical protein
MKFANEKMCRTKPTRIEAIIVGYHAEKGQHTAEFKKHKTLVCPDCKRRMKSSIVKLKDDGEDAYIIYLPPHKKKGWWKKCQKQ